MLCAGTSQRVPSLRVTLVEQHVFCWNPPLSPAAYMSMVRWTAYNSTFAWWVLGAAAGVLPRSHAADTVCMQ